MTYTFKLSRRLALLPYFTVPIPLLLALIGCSDSSLTGTSDSAQPSFRTRTTTPVELVAPTSGISPRSAVAEPNQPIQFKVMSASLSGTTVQWTASGGTISKKGNFKASTPGIYSVRAQTRRHQVLDSALVTVVPAVTGLVAVRAAPESATVAPGVSVAFTATGVRQDNSSVPVGVTWSATGGTVDEGGVYTAGRVAGTYRVIATGVDSALADTAVVIVPPSAPAPTDSTPTPPPPPPDTTPSVPPPPPPPPPTLVSLALTPVSVSMAAGSQQQFTAVGRWSDGSSRAWTGPLSATGGSVTSAGLYTAGAVGGAYRVIARDSSGDVADTSSVTIVVPTPSPTCVSTSTSLCPGDDIAGKVAAAPSGTAFTFAPGMYRLQSVAPKTGDSFTGPRSAILSGAILVTGWTRTGSGWSAGVNYTPGPLSGTCASGTACQNPNDVYRDDALLRSGYSLTATTLTVFDDPTGHRIELLALPRAFTGGASGVRLSGFTVEKYAAPYNSGAVNAASGPNWVIDGLEGRWNHGAAVFAGPSGRVTNGYFHHNGQYGLMGNSASMVIQGNEVSYNNTAGFSQSWAAGGAKFAFTTGLLVTGNFFHHNYGHAIWVDINNYQAVIENNRVEDNDGRGVFYEISYDAVIRNNTFARNGFKAPVLLRGGCVGVVSSSNVEVYGNTCVGDKDGITGVQDERGSGSRGHYDLTNLKVHDNVLTGITTYSAGIVQTVGDTTYYHRGNVFSGNSYSGLVSSSPFYWMNAARTPSQWAAYGQH